MSRIKKHGIDNDNGFTPLTVVLVFILVMAVCFAVGQVFGEEPTGVSPNRYLIDDIRVTDGDTIKADIHLGLGVVLNDETLRASDYDAWESSYRRRSKDVTITPEEVEKGKLAKIFLAGFLPNHEAYIELHEKQTRDVYGRILGQWHVLKNGEWFSVAEVMRLAGHLRSNEPVASVEKVGDSFAEAFVAPKDHICITCEEFLPPWSPRFGPTGESCEPVTTTCVTKDCSRFGLTLYESVDAVEKAWREARK